MGLFMTSLLGASIANAINDARCAVSPVKKAYKHLERQGALIKMRKTLEQRLEAIEDECHDELTEFALKFNALNAYLALSHRIMRREELYAARQAYRKGDIGPAMDLAKRNAEIKDLLEEYFW